MPLKYEYNEPNLSRLQCIIHITRFSTLTLSHTGVDTIKIIFRHPSIDPITIISLNSDHSMTLKENKLFNLD